MRVSFIPAQHGFAFTNDFVNPISIAGIPIEESRGRCGGMAFAALDYWHHRLPVPESAALPADGTPLADYIYHRLINSIVDNWFMYLHLMLTPDHPTVASGKGVARATREDEFPKLKKQLDQGIPQPLGLVRSRRPGDFPNDHQVVAYGYEQDETHTRVFIWDNNFPRREDVLTFTTGYDPDDQAVHHSGGTDWRGFFVSRYSPQHPWFLAENKLLSEVSGARVYAIHRGAKFWINNPAEFERLGYRWSEVVELPETSLSHVDDVPGDGVFVRELDRPEVLVVYGGAAFHIPDPGTLSRLAGNSPIHVLPRDGAAVLRKVPVDGTLLREESQPPVYLVEGGMLRLIPDPETFAARGVRWDRVGVVPDTALATLPLGFPLPAVHPLSWAGRPSGHLLTSDSDRIECVIEPGVRPFDEVEFVLAQAEGLTWRKEIMLYTDEGCWTIGIQNGIRVAASGLHRNQLPTASLTLRKAKLFGIMTGVLDLRDLDHLPEGARVTFTWATD
jgi:hypothetical protein